MTNSAGIFDRDVMICSVNPSVKYSCLGSPVMFSNGSTAMEGLSGSGSAAFFTGATPAGGEDDRK